MGDVRVKSVLLNQLERMENESRLTEDVARRSGTGNIAARAYASGTKGRATDPKNANPAGHFPKFINAYASFVQAFASVSSL